VDSVARRVAPLAELIQTVTPLKRNRRPANFSLKRKEFILPKGVGESVARRFIRLTDVIPRVGPDKDTRRPAETTMEPKVKNTKIRSGSNGRWAVAPSAHVAITFLGLYYAGRGVISKILCRDSLLVEVKIIEVSPAIEVEIPFPVGDLPRISQCARREVVWEAEHLRQGCLWGGPPARSVRLIDLRARLVRVKWALTDRHGKSDLPCPRWLPPRPPRHWASGRGRNGAYLMSGANPVGDNGKASVDGKY
jgi:hypothetical protein